MRYSIAFVATVLASIAGTASANVRVQIQGFPETGTYNDLQSFDKQGNCPSKPYTWSGKISPLDEELGLIFRGPMKLKQIAVYSQDGSAPKKRSARLSAHQRRHGHQHFHERNQEVREEHAQEEKRGMAVHVFDGETKTFDANWGGTPTPAPAPGAAAPEQGKSNEQGKSKEKASPAPEAAKQVDAGAGNWGRVAYYNAAKGHASGLTFLANLRWDSNNVLGKLVAYVDSTGRNAVSSSAILEDCQIPDNHEVIVSTDKACNGNDCGATAPGGTPHHGFGGKNKIFMAEYSMPYSGLRGEKTYPNLNPDMPAFWALNQKIINAQTSGTCSCWKSGCGELDIHEVLEPGKNDGVVAMHMGKNYAVEAPTRIPRPHDKTMKIAAIISGERVQVHVLDDNFDFGDVVSSSTINDLLNHKDLKSINVNVNPSDVS